MKIARTILECREGVRQARREGKTVGLVPTMGALHAGHLELIKRCRAECGYAGVSIFVNPIQFGPREDLSKYPRPIERDLEMCEKAGVDLVFNPGVGEMYPERLEEEKNLGRDAQATEEKCGQDGRGTILTYVEVERLGEHLCGASRPGHFRGVCTVVAKLFNIFQPDVAYFGQKDAQQLAIIRRMARDLNFPVEIRPCPTVREGDGLALSSRNRYLGEEERRQAVCLWQALQAARELGAVGEREGRRIIGAMEGVIKRNPLARIDYISIVDQELLQPLEVVDRPALIALAVYVGGTRLIDNILVEPGEGIS